MIRTNNILGFLFHYKYLIVVIVGTLVVGILDENSFAKRITLEWQIRKLETEIARYNAINNTSAQQLKDLKRNPNAIKRIAREKYFMKADDEDIFVLSDDSTNKTIASSNEKNQ